MVPFLAPLLCQRNVAFAILGCARIGSGPSNALAVGARVPKGIGESGVREQRPNFFVAKLAVVENAREKAWASLIRVIREDPAQHGSVSNLLTSYGGRMAHRRGG